MWIKYSTNSKNEPCRELVNLESEVRMSKATPTSNLYTVKVDGNIVFYKISYEQAARAVDTIAEALADNVELLNLDGLFKN